MARSQVSALAVHVEQVARDDAAQAPELGVVVDARAVARPRHLDAELG